METSIEKRRGFRPKLGAGHVTRKVLHLNEPADESAFVDRAPTRCSPKAKPTLPAQDTTLTRLPFHPFRQRLEVARALEVAEQRRLVQQR
jgi:hypothetical protein